jgi:hypothetical protein
MAISVRTAAGMLEIELTGAHQTLALKRRIAIPLAQVTGAAVMDRSEVPHEEGTWLRMPGTHVPGLARLGSYGTAPSREFWAVFRQPDVLVIDLEDAEYLRLVLGVADPARTLSQIETALATEA